MQQKKNEEVHAAVVIQAVLLYSEGYGYYLPFTEENPERLSTYFRSNEINFALMPEELNYGESRPGQFCVPPAVLLDFFSSTMKNAVSKYERFYYIAHPEFPEIHSLQEFSGETKSILLPSREDYFLMLELNGVISGKPVYYVDPIIQASSGPRNIQILFSNACSIGSKNGKPLAYQYAYISGENFSPIQISTVNTEVLRKVSVFQIRR